VRFFGSLDQPNDQRETSKGNGLGSRGLHLPKDEARLKKLGLGLGSAVLLHWTWHPTQRILGLDFELVAN